MPVLGTLSTAAPCNTHCSRLQHATQHCNALKQAATCIDRHAYIHILHTHHTDMPMSCSPLSALLLHIQINIYTYILTYTHLHTYMPISCSPQSALSPHMYTHIYTYMHTCTQVYTDIHTSCSPQSAPSPHIRRHIHTNVHTYIHTYTPFAGGSEGSWCTATCSRSPSTVARGTSHIFARALAAAVCVCVSESTHIHTHI